MLAICISLVALLLSTSTLGAADGLTESKLEHLKRATVFIKSSIGTGSGFLVNVSANTGYIATNEHVIRSQVGRDAAQIECVFNCGLGDEFSVPGKVIAAIDNEDLAIVEVNGATLPKPLDMTPPDKLQETMELFILGYPFGEALAARGKHPTVTVGRGTISSLRNDEHNRLSVVQIDGDLNPGNSGGPVVTTDGRLVGIAVATVMGTDVSFAIPGQSLTRLLDGYPTKTTVTMDSIEATAASYEVGMVFADPLGRLDKAFVEFIPKGRVAGKPAINPLTGRYDRLSRDNRDVVILTSEKGKASGKVPLTGTNRDESYYVQFSYSTKGGERLYLAPAEIDVPFKTEGANRAKAVEIPGPSASTPTGPRIAFPEDIRETTTQTPKPIIDATIAKGGKLMVYRMQDLPVLAVYNLETRAVDRMIKLPTRDFLYATGGNVALVYAKENNLLSTWDLNTGEKIKIKPNPEGAIICRLTMGHSNDALALVRSAVGTGALDRASQYLLDVSKLQVIPWQDEETNRSTTGHNGSFRDYVHQRANADLTIISEWCTSHSPSGLGAYRRSGNKMESRYDHTSTGYISVGDDNKLYSETGQMFTSELRELGAIQGQQLFPGIGGALTLGMDRAGKLHVYIAGTTAPIAPVGDFPKAPGDQPRGNAWAATPFTFDRRILFNPMIGQVVLIPETNQEIIQRSFNLKSMLSQHGIDYLFVISSPPTTAKIGAKLSYQIQTMSNADKISHTLDLGPEGMALSEAGLITWTCEGAAGETENVIVTVKDSNGESLFHSFDLLLVP